MSMIKLSKPLHLDAGSFFKSFFLELNYIYIIVTFLKIEQMYYFLG